MAKDDFDRRQIASASSIVGLSDYGVAVTSENAKYLVQYLHDVENLNYDKIPESSSVSRLGWIGEEGFAPYVENLVFDGDIAFKHFFESVGTRGNFEKWKEAVKTIRAEGNVPAKILVAASFASVLVGPCQLPAFFRPSVGWYRVRKDSRFDAGGVGLGESGDGKVYSYV